MTKFKLAAVITVTAGVAIGGWQRDGKKHREDGPADIKRYADGTVIENYWRDGVAM